AIGNDGTIYFGGLSTILYAADGDTGEIKWTKNFGTHCDPLDANSAYTGGVIFTSPVIGENGTVYIAPMYDRDIYALNPADGSTLWQATVWSPYDPRYHGSTVWTTPALGPDDTIYVSCDNPFLRAISPDGSFKWNTRLGMIGGFTVATDSDGLIYAASDDGRLYVVDSNGLELARFEGQSRLSFPAIAGNNELIIADANDTVYCLSADCGGNTTQSLHYPANLSHDLQVNFIDFALFAENWLGCTDSYPPCQILSSYELQELGYPVGDIDKNWRVDYRDLMHLANNWLMSTCASYENIYCYMADIDESGKIDFVDFANLALHWGEVYPPEDWRNYQYIDGPLYLPGDINLDGYVDLEDLTILSLEWLKN
ncbi:MAG: PQQ-binding-like beta-propeller repeat protein, partial [Phycisphaerae bacterium]|nr:PQQ-binding-like beta-propeller repeat protein [Phycisphaerae bacterium]